VLGGMVGAFFAAAAARALWEDYRYGRGVIL